ncbi:hypothetical protein FKM82_014908 [Ascaphus truei]
MESDERPSHRPELCPSPEDVNPLVENPKQTSVFLSEHLESTTGIEYGDVQPKEEPQEWIITDVRSIAGVETQPEIHSQECVAGSESCVVKEEKQPKEEPDTWPITGDISSVPGVLSVEKQIKEEQEDDTTFVSRGLRSRGRKPLQKESGLWSESEDVKPLKQEPEECSQRQPSTIVGSKIPKEKPRRRKSGRLSRKVDKPRARPYLEPELFKCDTCDKVIKHLNSFREHQRIHTGERPYKCKVCKKNFTRCADLIKHRLVHSNRRPHKCKTCGKRFKLAGDLSKHSTVHSDLSPFKCESCEKSFKRTSCLIKHMRIHTEEKPFSCTECDKRFKWEASLREHRRIHTGEKPFRCPECDKSFTHFSTFLQHRRTHQEDSPFSCKRCKRSFNHKSNMLKHQRTAHI